MVPNRAQRSDLTRVRISSSQIALEVLRYQRPRVPEKERVCHYCRPSGVDNQLEGYVDNEQHLLTGCSTFTLERNCLFAKLGCIIPDFHTLNLEQKTSTLLCPTTVVAAKMVNKFIQLVFQMRTLLDDGVPALNLGFKQGVVYLNPFNDISNDSETED